ncbi:AEC family transporter [Microbacterium aquimaris]|uniref:AEC family transporter n=1 Tax=Microbacterium aquimaris TaxID=459816 RepID=A0ABU5N8L4_9MICO|nr:AEC family transporter [Microbacterium aquimaris]MDZ8162427.1 AEC family transporter [Microbacterium aquimaris]
MLESLTGFVVVGVAIAVGYIIARVDLLGEHARPVLARLTFFVLSPFLLFVVLAEADVRTLFSALLPVSAIAAAVAIGAYALVARLVWRRGVGETTIGALGAGQVNSNNIGIPLSVYLLGSAAYPAPVILLQLLVLTPITMAIFESVTAQRRSAGRILLRTVTNPLVIGSTLGTMVAVSGLELPAVAMEPVRLVADACVPVLLISYGMSLFGQRVLSASGRRRDVLLATALKLLVMPLTAWAIAEFVFGMTDHEVLVVVVLAALPTAQNVFNYSQRFGIGETISRDTVFLTTVGCVPILFAATLLWG